MTLANLEKVLLFLTLLFLPTQLGKHFWPQFSFVYSLPIDYLSPTFYFWDVLVMGLLLVWIFRKPKFNRLALNLFLLFLFTQLLSLPGASNIGVGLVRLEQYLLAGLFGIYLSSCKFSKIKSVVFFALAFSAAGESILAIIQFLKESTLGLWLFGERTFTIATPGIAKFDFYGREFLRPYATFPHPNVLAGFMLLAIVILNFFFRHPERLAEGSSEPGRFLTTFGMTTTTFLAGLTIFLTMSRVVILAGLVSLLLLMRRRWLVLMMLFLLIASPILFTRFFSLLNFDNLTLIRREELVGNAWQMFLKSPVFGIGLNNFIPAVASNLIIGPSRFLQPVHNIFLLALSETGLIGLIGWICLIGYPIKRMYNVQCTMYNWLPWVTILFLGIFDHYFLTLPQGIRLLFLIWGLSFSRMGNRSDF